MTDLDAISKMLEIKLKPLNESQGEIIKRLDKIIERFNTVEEILKEIDAKT